MPLIFLHGLGQTPASWNAVKDALEPGALCPNLFPSGGEVRYPALYRSLAAYCDAQPAPLRLCGLSLGGILALQYAAQRPERVGSLVLIGTQYVMPKRLLKFQNLIFRFLPSASFRQTGLSKRDTITLTQSMMDLNFQGDLERITCPVLVLCGERDKANRNAALELQKRLPHAERLFLPSAGHEVNQDAPEALAAALREFYNRHP